MPLSDTKTSVAVRTGSLSIVVAVILLSGCSAPKQSEILIHMLKAQEDYFAKETMTGFDREKHATTKVVHYENTGDLEAELTKHAGKAAIVKIPFEKSKALIRKNFLKPLDSFLTEDELKEFRSNYLLTSLGTYGDKQYLIPRKFETRIMVYCKSKVADAVSRWPTFKEAINEDMKKINGYGLPPTYVIEDDPNKWDFFDVYVVGWIWAHTPYDGRTVPRIGHRGKRYSGTSLRIIDRVFQCGGDSTQVLTMNGNAVTDAFMWEAVYASSVYNKRMWEEAWSGTEIWKGFRDGDVFLAFMTQVDCFFIHGTGSDGLDGYLANPDDMGVAAMPAGCSVLLDPSGAVLREGGKSVTTGGWWWGIPATTPDPRLSWAMAKYITGTKSQIQDCSRFGMIPVRKDILGDMSMMFGGGWVTSIYETSFRQLMFNKYTVIPGDPHFDEITDVYLDAWYDIVVHRNWAASPGDAPQWQHVHDVLATTYVPRVASILAR
jgi:ABC-type glycerol-3-phosphate transport system substrate-binding protein